MAGEGLGATPDVVLALDLLTTLGLILVPFTFLAGLARVRMVEAGALTGLLDRLRGAHDAAGLRAALAEALGDPTLRLAFW